MQLFHRDKQEKPDERFRERLTRLQNRRVILYLDTGYRVAGTVKRIDENGDVTLLTKRKHKGQPGDYWVDVTVNIDNLRVIECPQND